MSEHESLDWPGFLADGQAEIRRRVANYCRMYGAAGEMEDMGQVVLVKLLEKQQELHFDSPKKLFRYIRLMVRSELPRERARATGGGRTQLLDPTALAEIAPAVGGRAEDAPPVDELLAMIGDGRLREACRLYFVEGLKLEAVGKRLGVSTPTASRLIRSAREGLRIQLGATADPPEDVR